MKKKFDFAFFFLLLLQVFSSGCLPKKTSPTKKILKVVFVNPQKTLKTSGCETSPCREIQHLTGEGLFRASFIKNKLTIEPALAQSWEWLQPLQLEIQLKKNQKKSDGSPLTSNDFIDAWRQALTSKDKSELQPFFIVKHAHEFFEKKVAFSKLGFKAPNSTSIQITFSTLPPNFQAWLAHPAFQIAASQRNSVGPFSLAYPKSNEFLLLTRNPFYWNSNSLIDEIWFREISDKNLAHNLIEDKEVQIAVGSFSENPRPDTHYYPSSNQVLLLLNSEHIALKSTETRKLLLSVIKNSSLGKIPAPLLLPNHSLDPFYENDPASDFYYMPQKTKPDLSQPLGLIELSFPLSLKPIATFIEMQWLKELNLSTELIPWTSAHTSNAARAAWLVPLKVDVFRPDLGINHLLKQSQELKLTHSIRKFSKCLEEFKKEEIETAEQLHGEIEKIEKTLIQEQALYYPLGRVPIVTHHSDKLKGLKIAPNGVLDFSQVTF